MDNINSKYLNSLIETALKEDIGSGDITTESLIPASLYTSATISAKAAGVIAGLEVAEAVFKSLSPEIDWQPKVKDGDSVVKGELIAELSGPFRALLSGERLALNFLQRMSGIASMTRLFVELTEQFGTKILDTRKTVPGLRLLDKYAVKAGGGQNHRIGLYDMVLIKDNHIKIAGGIEQAVHQIRSRIPAGMLIEVETTTKEEVLQALAVKADIIMLDNMSNEQMYNCVQLINHAAKVEASGNMSLERIKEVAATGVDYISIGALTHSVTALDISMNIKVNRN